MGKDCRAFIFATLFLAVGCAEDTGDSTVPPGEEGLPVVVTEGKEDNFFAPRAQEYLVEGRTTITLEGEDAELEGEERLQRVKRLIPYKQVVIGWFLNAYIQPKSHDADNADYGDFQCLTKNGSYEELNIEELEDGSYAFTFRQELGGPLDLLERLPTEVSEDGVRTFDLTIGKISNADMQLLETNREWYRKAPWKKFDPTKVDADRLDAVKLTITAEPRSIDAWFDYARLFEDGVMSIGVHYGWDYHEAYHLKHSESVYTQLVAKGYESPAESYDEYTRTSGPLVRTITAFDKELRVEISLFWGKPGSDTDPDTAEGGRQLEDDMRTSFKEMDAIVFSGHSGPFYGFALANWRKTDEGDLDDSEIAGLEMPKDRYQVVLAEGCETYALGEAFWHNPSKEDRKNLDIITTGSFSSAGSPAAVTDFLYALVGTNGEGVHKPKTIGELLKDLDSNSFWFSTMYGVHGIDDNPHLHPYAQVGSFCGACEDDEDCGPKGNFCVALVADADGICTARCTADDACPEGYSCADVATGWHIGRKGCVPENNDCSFDAPPLPEVVLNEVLADPPAELAGDANGDGLRDDAGDQFVELLNISALEADLAGWTISDGQKVRFTFPNGTILAPGGAAVVFGAAPGEAFSAPEGVQVFTAKEGLMLDAEGDSVLLHRPGDHLEDSLVFGAEGSGARSLVRPSDGEAGATWEAHPGELLFSPGTQSDGSPF